MFLYELKRNVASSRGGARNLSDGTSVASLMHFIDASKDISPYGGGELFDEKEYIDLYRSRPDISLIIYSKSSWLFTDPTYVDCVVITPTGKVYAYNRHVFSNDRGNCRAEFSANVEKHYFDYDNAVVDLLTSIVSNNDEGEIDNPLEDTDNEKVYICAVDKAGNLYSAFEQPGKFGNWDYAGEIISLTSNEETVTITEETKNIQLTEKESNTMSTIKNTAVTVVNANKSAAVTAAKITAGKVALKQVSKVALKALPASGMAGMFIKANLDTPIGRVVIANLLNFAVQHYAAGNKKAVLVADAAMTAAMLEAVESFNIPEMIEKALEGISVEGLTETEE